MQKYYTAFSVCLSVFLLIVLWCQTFLGTPATIYTSYVANTSRFKPVIPFNELIRSTKETLYVMYGDENMTEFDDKISDYIRSLASIQAPGGRHLSAHQKKNKGISSSHKNRVDFSQFGGAAVVDKLLQHRRNGFFVECGAFRGEALSDTLFFELERNWTGLLIEPHPVYHKEILGKNRRALVLRACLSATPHPGLVKFKLAGWGSGVSALNKNPEAKSQTTSETDVQCFTLNSIMAAFGVRHIDFMVLDVEGSEIPVLETIDWTRLTVDVWSIEYNLDGNPFDKLNKIRQILNKTEMYREVGKLPVGASVGSAQDVIFMRINK